MAATQKYKVNNMAKDLDKKTKEIVELLKDKGFDGKSSSSVMENAEINIVLNHYISKSEVSDIAAYLATPKPTEKAEAAPAAKAEAAKEPAKAPASEAKPEAKPETKPVEKAEVKAEAKPEIKPVEKTEENRKQNRPKRPKPMPARRPM